MYSIGQFSRISGLSVKTLRLYHEKGVLVPSRVDEETGYRYYNQPCIEHARVVSHLRGMDFPLAVIREILEQYSDEGDILDYLEQRKKSLELEMHEHQAIIDSLSSIILKEQEAKRIMENSAFEIEEKEIAAILIAGVRMCGAYHECGKGFGLIGRKLNRRICGKAMCLYYDDEYKEKDADFEACMPVRPGKEVEGISIRELPACKCVTLLHQGPYDDLGRSYEKVYAYIRDKGYEVERPTRDIFLKGPGMIFKGNPEKYLTEIQIPVKIG